MRKGLGCLASFIVFFIVFALAMVVKESSGGRPGGPNHIGVMVAGVCAWGIFRAITYKKPFEEEDKE